MPRNNDRKQEKAWKFLFNHFISQRCFTKSSFNRHVGWGSNLKTYWSKKIRTFLVKKSRNRFRVSESFRRTIDWPSFKRHISQSTTISTDYKTFSYKNVVLFEFFLPLSNEPYLRTTLDALFYKDSIKRRLKNIPLTQLRKHFPKNEGELRPAYYKRIYNWISTKFGGYSIAHVSGRFRANDLIDYEESYKLTQKKGQPYLVDETTAIIRFIFPCGSPEEQLFLSTNDYFSILANDSTDKDSLSEAHKIRWFFYILFVQSIVEIVNGEAEIWLLESGIRNRLHIWKMQQ